MAGFGRISLLTLCILVGLSSGLAEYHYYGNDSTNSNSSSNTPFIPVVHLRSHSRPRSPFSPPQSPVSYPVFISLDTFEHYNSNGDHTNVFKKAWDKACATKNAVIVVPKGRTYSVKKLTFSGPCVSDISMEIRGTIRASGKMSDFSVDRRHWIIFKNVDGLTISGNGTIDGNGEIWWKNSCKINKQRPCKHAPTAMTFYSCKNLTVEGITVRHAQQMHLTVEDCVNVMLSKVTISSPGHSPNTDGIHVTSSSNVYIVNSHIATGDDCISIVTGSSNVQATDVTCGPGHGISIGSLGKDGERVKVSNIHVNRAKLTGTTNGVRIKSWQGGSGYARDITFENVEMNNVTNPIIIDQNYCDQKKPCSKSGSAVQVSRVIYRNIHGTSHSDEAIKLDCSEKYPCKGISFVNVNLEKEGGDHGKKAKATCKNTSHLRAYGRVVPDC